MIQNTQLSILKLNSDISVFQKQLFINEIEDLSDLGYKTILCNRPDNEEGAIPSSDLERECSKFKIAFFYLPFDSQSFNQTLINKCVEIIATCRKPLLGYCRTGTRSKILLQSITI